MNGQSPDASLTRPREPVRRRRGNAAALAMLLLATIGPASAQFDPGDLPARVPPAPVLSIYDTLAAPERSPQGTSRESVSQFKADQGGAAATCEARDSAVTKLYQRAYDSFDQKDPIEASYWLRSGFATRLDARDGRALARLGYILISDENPKRDAAAARIVWELAATAGSRDAVFNLGYLFETGVGVQADPDKALAWYEKAQAAGHEKAAEAIKRVRAKR